MKNLKRQDRNGVRHATDIERKYKLGQIDYTAEEIQELKMKLTVDSSLSASSSNAVANSVITQALNNKVNKETGKGLSTNDFTDELLDKVNNMQAGDTLPIGAVIEWDSDTIPENWLLLDGQAVSRTVYSELFKLYGTRYGEGDGNTTFNLPNRKTKVAVGKDSTDSDFNALGKTGGEKAHKLTINEIPNHRHGIYNYNANGSNLTESSSIMLGETATGWSGNGFTTYEGGGAAHNNLQPYFVTNFIVKAKQGNAPNVESTSVVLYEDATGTKGNITLPETVANFSYIEVYFHRENAYELSVKISNPNGKRAKLQEVGGTYIHFSVIAFSEDIIETGGYSRSVQITDGTATEYDTNIFNITKVVGYR